MPITREQCLEWAEEVYGKTYWNEAMSWRLEALCQKVWQEAQKELRSEQEPGTIGQLKAAYYDGHTDREQELRNAAPVAMPLTKTEEGEEIDRLMAIIEDQAQQIDRLTIAMQAPYDLQAMQSKDGVDMNRLF